MMQYCPKSIPILIKEKKEKGEYLSNTEILQYFSEILNALHYLQENHIIHRNLKPDNILISEDNHCILQDFSLAEHYDNLQTIKSTLVGTPLYMAPEMIIDRKFHIKSETWSLGLILYELCSLESIYDQIVTFADRNKLYSTPFDILKCNYSKDIDNRIIEILQMCLKRNPDDRPSIDDLIYNNTLIKPIYNNIIKKDTITATKEEESKIIENNVSYKYTILSIIKKILNGNVYKVKWNNSEVVLKKEKLIEKNDIDKWNNEIKTLKSCSSPYIIHYYDYFKEKDDNNNEFNYCILIQYYPLSLRDILNKMKKENKYLSFEEIMKYFNEILLGLEYLHNHHILYLNLKPENILITNDNHCVLTNLRNSISIDNLDSLVEEKIEDNNSIDSYYYLSPEQIDNKPFNSKSDIFSLGLLLYEMCTNESLFNNINTFEELKKIIHIPYNELNNSLLLSSLSNNNNNNMIIITELLSHLLKQNPTERPTMEQINRHLIINPITHKYERINTIGYNTNGAIYKVKWNNQLIALKRERVKTDSDIEYYKHESEIIKCCKNEYIIRYYDSFIDTDEKGNKCYSILMQYCYKSLDQLIKNCRDNNNLSYFNDEIIKKYFSEILNGIKYLHSKNIIHCNVKTSNILLTEDHHCVIKGFADAVMISDKGNENVELKRENYSVYSSPEEIKMNIASKKSDIWSLGLILYELCNLKPLFSNIEEIKTLDNCLPEGIVKCIKEIDRKDYCNIIMRCLNINPEKRPSVEDLIKMI